MKKKIISTRQFQIAFLLKVILMCLFSSDYSTLLFQPFVSEFVNNGFKNPYDLYFQGNRFLDAFPYHSLMLFLLTPFSLISGITGWEGFFDLPLVIADLSILIILLRLFPNKEKRVFYFYFLNPIVIYAVYIHSQLDIIPTALLFSSIYLLKINKLRWSAIFLGFALATKFHVVIAIPLLVFYLYKLKELRIVIEYTFISLVVLLAVDLPYLFSEGFLHMVLLNPKQTLLFDTFYSIGSVKFLLPVAAIVLVYFHFFNQKKVNDDLLFFYFGLLFTATVFFIYPGPAWYIWMIPYVSIYFIQNENLSKTNVLYGAFVLAYVVFFILFYISEYRDVLFMGKELELKLYDENLRNLSFTILEVTLLAIIYAFYKFGIKSNSIYQKQTNLSIGIGGDSGVGKTTLLNSLHSILGDKLLQIEGDGEHKWERGNANWKNFTHLNPKANHIHQQADAIYDLKHNKTIYRSEYDHTNGKFTEPKKVLPKEFIVIAGLHPFYLPKLRKNIDLKIYIDTDETLRRHWKILRDTKKRGYSTSNIMDQIESRMADAKKYIYPQKDFSDLIVRFFPVETFNLGDPGAKVNMGLKLTFDANIHVESLIEKLDCDFIWDYNDDLKSQFIELKSIPRVDFDGLATEVIDNISEIIALDAKWHEGYDGFIQLISLKMISQKLKDDN